MRVVERYLCIHESKKPTPEQAVEAKLQVLEDFYIVDNQNRDSMERMLKQAIKDHPDRDYEIVLDEVAKKLIMEKLN
jgi:predicted metal-dependent hydrolase